MAESDMLFFIFVPCSVIYMVSIIVYITHQSHKLRQKLIASGSLISTVPVLYISNVHQTQVVSPNGVLPPPQYSATAPSQQTPAAEPVPIEPPSYQQVVASNQSQPKQQQQPPPYPTQPVQLSQ